MSTKFCKSCGMVRSVDEFAPRTDRAGWRYRCRACDRAYSRRRYIDYDHERHAVRYLVERVAAGARTPIARADRIAHPVGYHALHARIRRTRGRANGYDCAHCGGEAHQWAYDHTDPNPLVGSTSKRHLVKYSLDVARYLPLCRPCHTRFDRDASIKAAARELLAKGYR